MPTIRLGGGVQDARGSIGGQTFRKGRSGHLLQSRRGPINKRSSRQSKSRTIFRKLTQYWSNDLSNVQRTSWKIYADTITTQNKLGQSVHLTGFHHFIAFNSLRLQFDDAIVSDGPTTLTRLGPDTDFSCTPDELTQKITVHFDHLLPWASLDDGRLYVTMSQPKAAGVANLNKSFRLAGVINGKDGDPPTSPVSIDVPFPVSEDQRILCKARISEGDGRLSSFFRFRQNRAA